MWWSNFVFVFLQKLPKKWHKQGWVRKSSLIKLENGVIRYDRICWPVDLFAWRWEHPHNGSIPGRDVNVDQRRPDQRGIYEKGNLEDNHPNHSIN